MTPDERQLISGLFDRMRQAGTQPRDREAEALIADQVRAQPYAPYLLAQTVLVQEQALRAANAKILQLEDQLRKQDAPPPHEETSFLGGLGKSLFGGGTASQPRPAVPTTGGYGPAPLPQEPGPFRGQGNPGASAGPWGGAAAPAAGGGGSFLKGALGAAAGVAGGVLLADGIRDLFSGGHNAFGIGSGFGGGGFGNSGGGETIVNNYYDSPAPGPDSVDFGDAQGGDFGNDGFDPGGFDGGDYGNDPI